MNPILYNIPASHIQQYQTCPLIVRVADSAIELKELSENVLERLTYLQVLSLEAAGDELSLWGEGIPLELCLQEPEREFSKLYRFARLLDSHPVRISIPVCPGFSKAVKVSMSLNFAVKLLVEQPDEALFGELMSVLDFYLHHSTASQPVDFFHSILLAMYHHDTVNVWTIQDENPEYNRYISEHGEESFSRRFLGQDVNAENNSTFLENFVQELLDRQGECGICEFFEYCRGYFKWPRKDYSCKGIKMIFHTLREAGQQLQEQLKGFENHQQAR